MIAFAAGSYYLLTNYLLLIPLSSCILLIPPLHSLSLLYPPLYFLSLLYPPLYSLSILYLPVYFLSLLHTPYPFFILHTQRAYSLNLLVVIIFNTFHWLKYDESYSVVSMALLCVSLLLSRQRKRWFYVVVSTPF